MFIEDNNLCLNEDKMNKIVVNFRKMHTQCTPLTIEGVAVERESNCPVVATLHHLPKKPNNSYTFSTNWRRAKAPAPIIYASIPHHAPYRAFWQAASPCGMAPAPCHVRSALWEQLGGDHWCLSHFSFWTSTTIALPAKPSGLVSSAHSLLTCTIIHSLTLIAKLIIVF